PARALPLLRQRRRHSRQGLPHAVPALLPRVRYRAHRRDAIVQHARSARGRGLVRAGRRDPAHARSRDVRDPALRAAHRPPALRHDDARGDAVGRLSAELPLRLAHALRCADNQTTLREPARGVAARHGLLASFAPKPFPDQAGNGAHIHFSLWAADGEQNVFHDPRGRYGLSDAGFAFIGGVLAHLPALVALTAPTVNSYRRLQPRFWSSAYTAWGPDNREGAIRVPSQRRGIE